MERRLVAILDADAVGYAKWMGTDEEAAFAALTERRQIIDANIIKRCGRIFGSAGDSVVAEFVSSVEAARCAVQIQNELRELNQTLPETERMDFRIGINFGDVIADNGDLLGDGVNIAARIESLAPAGGVCISRQVAEQISGKLNADFVRAGRHKLKHIDKPVEVWCWPPECAAALRLSSANWRKAVVLGALVGSTAVGMGYVLLHAGHTPFRADTVPESAPVADRLAAEDHALTLQLQTALAKLGCGPVHIDGRWDWRSQKALENFARHAGLRMPGDAVSYRTLRLLQRQKGRVCPPVCGPRHILVNGRCVAGTCPQGRVRLASGKCAVPSKLQ